MDVIDLLQLKVYEKLTENGYNAMDIPQLNEPFPFIKLGDISYEVEKNKLGKVYGYDIAYQLNLWTEQGDKQKQNYMINHIQGLLLELEMDDLTIIDIDTDVNMTDFEEARQAIITLSLKIDI